MPDSTSLTPASAAPLATATSEAAEPAAESVATLLDAEPVAPTPTPFAPYTAESLKEFLPDAPEAALGLFNKYQLSTEAVKDLVAYQTTLQQDAAKATATAWADHNKAWQDAVRADPVLGGAKLDQNLAAIKGLVTEYGDASFQEMLSLTGAGNHPGSRASAASKRPAASAG